LDERVLVLPDPHMLGAPLYGALAGKWRYRIGDIRIVARLENQVLTIVVVQIGNRREIYR
jgi:mRNA interferase RelE/StbE